MEILYRRKPSAENENSKLKAEIDAALSICIPFDIYCGEEFGMWGIWMIIDERKYMVDPISLTNSLYRDGWYFGMLTYYSGDGKAPRDVHVRKDEYYFTWTLGLGISTDQRPRHFNFDNYLGKVRQCVNEFYKAIQDGRPVDDVRSTSENKDIDMAVKQLSVEGVAPGYYRVMSSWLKKEEFVFCFDPHDKYHEMFTIGIGDRQYATSLPHVDNDYEVIRHQLESFAFDGEASIKLIDCLSEGLVKIRQTSVLKEIIDKGDGFSFSYEDYALVEIQPYEHLDGPILKGYCDEKQAIKTLYEGFLLLGMYHDEVEKDTYEPARIEAYNMFKSPILERYIVSNQRNDYTHSAKRQTRMHEILIIEPGVDALFWDCEGAATVIPEKYVTEEVAELVGQMESWASEIKPVIIACAVNKPQPFDWADYHSRGLALAQKLRSCLSDEVDLWYHTPAEDHSGIQPPMQLIYHLKE